MSATTFDAAVKTALAREVQVRLRRYLKLAIWGAIAVGILWYAAVQIKLSPGALFKGVPFMWDFIKRLFPPDFSYLSLLGTATIETVQIAIWGTLLAIIFSIPLSFLGARNTTPHIIVFHLTRMLLNALRAINELVFALIFVSAVGLGPFAGVLAVALHATGMLAKFCAEEIEGVDKGQVEAQMATGATRMQVVLYGVAPQIVPQFIGYAIYRLDVSIRSATVLGFVGAGGLGFSLIQTMKLFQYHKTATCIFVIFLLVLISDWICARLRRKVI